MLNDFRPQTGGADAQAFYDQTAAGLAPALNPPTRLAGHEADATLTGVPLPISTEVVARRRPEGVERLEMVWHLLNDRGFIALKNSSVLGQRAAYWMVLLTLFTDMKATELVHLRPADFAWTSCAGHLMRHPPSQWGGGRLHPVHRVLIQCGLLEFIAERWAAKAAYLLSDSTKPDSSPRAARRYICRVWGEAGQSVSAPSQRDFKAARVSEAAKLLREHPELLSRLEESCRQGGLLPADEMQLVLDLEQAVQFDDVNWDRHYSVAPVRFDG